MLLMPVDVGLSPAHDGYVSRSRYAMVIPLKGVLSKDNGFLRFAI